MTDLSHTSVSPTSAPRLASDLAKAEQQLNALKGQGTGAFSAQVTQLSNALNAIKKAAEEFQIPPERQNRISVRKLGDKALKDIFATLKRDRFGKQIRESVADFDRSRCTEPTSAAQ